MSNKIKILAIIPGKGKPRAMQFAVDECNNLNSDNCIIDIFWIYGGISIINFIVDLYKLRKKIVKFRPDILHAQYGTITSFITILSSFGTPVVVTFRGSDLQPSRFDGRLRNFGQLFLSYISAIFSSYVICVSSDLRRKLWFSKKNISVIPSGIDLNHFKPIEINSARNKIGLNSVSRIILFYSSAKLKRLDLALKLVDDIKYKIPEVELIVLDGSTEKHLMPYYLSAANVLLFLSDNEGSPNLIREANACNLPVVSFDVGDVASQLENVTPGGTFGRDLNRIKIELVNILTDLSRSNGREFVGKFSFEVLNTERHAVYNKLLNSA